MPHNLKFWQVDAFTNKPFKGNPAAVFVLDEELESDFMQNIAVEMNLSETAYILRRSGQNPLLRWFTPMFEIDLCGHATLASAHIYLTKIEPERNSITFDTNEAGSLTVSKQGDGYVMDFPMRPGTPKPLTDIPDFVFKALSPTKPAAAFQARDLMLVYDDAETVRNMTPDFNALMTYKDFIIVTAPSDDPEFDCVSRFFCADDGIAEDPVTGSAHCTIAPYWAERLDKSTLRAYQASKRGGVLNLEMKGDRLDIGGQAITVLQGELLI